ncbi:50S ribosomal protein L21 [Pajaroellobacter abortibovis]|uniref:Large ribosomal subunit protein bL21 n=1 Tax=Pajaroellobacter abortibovis TaxID=1882918 RepID=A0A1L6MY97_9BACT|nr:50S ribosomal protein L21 [Pajaroellobacter abortibovis]APS00543.1 50S ribosomal protein L21 [Pajaroellobacter abortibovis]
MTYAIFKTGGKQYQAVESHCLQVEKLNGSVGDTITFEEVLMIGGDHIQIGQPWVPGAKVHAMIKAHGRSKKIIVFKFRRRKNYRRKRGHRQPFTTIQITQIATS